MIGINSAVLAVVALIMFLILLWTAALTNGQDLF